MDFINVQHAAIDILEVGNHSISLVFPWLWRRHIRPVATFMKNGWGVVLVTAIALTFMTLLIKTWILIVMRLSWKANTDMIYERFRDVFLKIPRNTRSQWRF